MNNASTADVCLDAIRTGTPRMKEGGARKKVSHLAGRDHAIHEDIFIHFTEKWAVAGTK